MTKNKDILAEAFAEAKLVKELSVRQAKSILDEHLNKKIRKVVSKKLTEGEEVEDNEENLEESDFDVKDDVDSDEFVSEDEDMDSDDELTEEDEVDSDDEDLTEDEMDSEDDEDLTEDEDMDSEDDEDLNEEDEVTPDEDDLNLDEELEDLDSEDGESDEHMFEDSTESLDDAGIEDLDEDDELEVDDDSKDLEEGDKITLNDEGDEDLNEEDEDLETILAKNESKKLRKENYNLKKKVNLYEKAIRSLKAQFESVNLLNTKLHYSGKIIRNFSLSENEKRRVYNTMDRANSIRECKLIYTTIAESLKKATVKKMRSVAESKSSRPVSKLSNSKKRILQENKIVKRWQKLGNVNPNK